MTLIILIATLTASLCLNAALFARIRKKPKRPESLELREFLGDLLSGPGIVAVGRIDPGDILMRSPKQR